MRSAVRAGALAVRFRRPVPTLVLECGRYRVRGSVEPRRLCPRALRPHRTWPVDRPACTVRNDHSDAIDIRGFSYRSPTLLSLELPEHLDLSSSQQNHAG